ncbi:urease accessory protein UreF [Clostridium celatum]|mgnify:FL=1|uniref:Urease accessory protein UreF n=2 Tax=Clostridium celatum TaxID=36834 RepID=L1QA53_9CLOT|nr:urease accessory protein UreF [Clostridium celatum]EKY24610.1 urease accessory protein UreF [Clostridium celatum DSM 1785]MDY3360738.1 urease accessory protein UreF [Clostridium celatum]
MLINNNDILNVLRVIQVCDSNFPVGSFNHSYGMETYLRLNRVYNANTFREWLNVYLKEQFIYTDALAIKMLYEYLNDNNLRSVYELDRLITVQCVAKESRNAGKLVASRMIKLFMELYDIDLLKNYDEKLRKKECFGHPALVFGMLMYSLGFNLEEAIIYHMYSTISTLISNAVRTIPLGQKDGQILLKEFIEEAGKLYDVVINLDYDYFGANSPGLELSQIKHEIMEFRLFMS